MDSRHNDPRSSSSKGSHDEGVARKAGDDESIQWWPAGQVDRQTTAKVVVGSVSHNTLDLVALLIWSVYRSVSSAVSRVVVVDNASDDGSLEFLLECQDARLCEVIANPTNRYHGPALNQVVSHLTRQQLRGEAVESWVWLLDSDCVVARGDTVTHARRHARDTDAVLIGERKWDRWHDEERLRTFSLMFDPARAWRPPTRPFVEDGDPAREFELSIRNQPGLRVATFPFTTEGYVIHRGRGTLSRVRDRDDTANRYHTWAADHHEAHFELSVGAERHYRDLHNEFAEAVGQPPTANRFVDAVAALG